MKALDLTGQTFGNLIVMSFVETRNKKRYWLCECKCGKTTEAQVEQLRQGRKNSCGCMRSETMRNISTVHAMKHHPNYCTWINAKVRVFDKQPKYHTYVGKGMWEGWVNDAEAFIKYITALPNYGKDGYSLDRVNNSHGYYPGNLRWANAKQQADNRG